MDGKVQCKLISRSPNGGIMGAQGDKNNCGMFKSNASGSVSNVLVTNMKLGSTLTVDAGATQVYIFKRIF